MPSKQEILQKDNSLRVNQIQNSNYEDLPNLLNKTTDWESIVGIFADDPAFEEAIAIGKEYRRACQDLFDPSETE